MATFPPASGFYNVLDPTKPTASDFVQGGYAWLQWIQQNMVNQWPNLKNASTPAAANPNPQELNTLVGLNTGQTLEARIAALETGLNNAVPVGSIVPWPVKETIPQTYSTSASPKPGPGGWRLCDGSTLNGSASPYDVLFSLIGNQYGGTGASTMRIPDIQGRVIAGRRLSGTDRLTGYRQGVNDNLQGNAGGEEAHVQASDELRSHSHGRGGRNVGNTTDSGSGAQIYQEVNTLSAGSSVKANIVQPTFILAWYIRVE